MELSGEEDITLLLRGPSGEKALREEEMWQLMFFFNLKYFQLLWQWEGSNVLEPWLTWTFSLLCTASPPPLLKFALLHLIANKTTNVLLISFFFFLIQASSGGGLEKGTGGGTIGHFRLGLTCQIENTIEFFVGTWVRCHWIDRDDLKKLLKDDFRYSEFSLDHFQKYSEMSN